MKRSARRFHFRFYATLLSGAVLMWGAVALGQGSESERAFPQSKAAVEKALKEMQIAVAGRLPTLDGFAISANHPLENYRRGYYQAKFQVSAAPSGGSTVRVSVEVTAWYNDPAAAKSGYQLLSSNGRIEADLLDQLSDQLAAVAPGSAPLGSSAPAAVATQPARPRVESAPPPPAATTASSQPKISAPMPKPADSSGSYPPASAPVGASAPTAAAAQPARPAVASAPFSAATTASNEPEISAPMPRLPDSSSSYASSPLGRGLAGNEKTAPEPNGKKVEELNTGGPLESELASLQEIIKNQGHPQNLVAVKKSGTPVVSSASLTAKTLFLASAHDEFEMLDYNRDWVHVRISGLSRGWIWRNNLEMPSNVPDTDTAPAKSGLPSAAELFRVSREEVAQFPGDWAPLRGKNVKIVSVEDAQDNAKTDSLLRLEFAKSVIQKDYDELAQKTRELAGIVVIFDAVDGGMMAAAFPTLQQWKAGKLSDAALWHQCFFDPPETFGVPNSVVTQKSTGSSL